MKSPVCRLYMSLKIDITDDEGRASAIHFESVGSAT